MAARWQGVNETGQGWSAMNVPSKFEFVLDPPLSVSVCVYLWIHSAKSLFMQVDGIDHADDGGIDGRVGAANGGHGGKAFRS
jgi:hypothetical protein